MARSHGQIIWRLADGLSTAEGARVTGSSGNWVREIGRRYQAAGPGGLGDRRHANPGGAPLLTPAQQVALQAALAEPPPAGGVGTCRTVAAWIGATIGRPVAEGRGWEGMRRLGCTWDAPPNVPGPVQPAPTRRRRPNPRRASRSGRRMSPAAG